MSRMFGATRNYSEYHLFSSTNYTHHNVTNATNLVYQTNKRHMIGLALAIGGNLLISISLSVQKKAHNRLGHERSWAYCLDKLWWLGMLLMVLGELGNFMAYGFAPASMVAPLGSVAVLTNSVIAIVFLREPITLPNMIGVTFVIVGAILLITFSVKGRPLLTSAKFIEYLEAWPFLLYLGVQTVILVVLLYLKYARKNEHLVILLLLVGIIASVTVIASKALSTLISESILLGHQEIMNPVFWVSLIILPITTITQIRFLNRAMQLYDVSDVVPVNFIFFTVSAILAGAMFYEEFKGVQFDRVFIFLFGCILSFIGVYTIAHQNKYKTAMEEDQRKRTSTNDSGLDSGSSSADMSDASVDSSDLVSISDDDVLSSGKEKFIKKPQGDATELRKFAACNLTGVASTSCVTTTSLKQFVRDLKSTETIHRVQPEMSEDSDY